MKRVVLFSSSRKLVADNYNSVTQKHFQRTKGADGTEPLPRDIHRESSGFLKGTHKTTATSKDAYSVFKNPASTGFITKPPVLHRLTNKDPIARENNNNGPTYFSSENRSQFCNKQGQQLMDTTSKTLGPKEGSGFSRAKNLEPVTFRPDECHDGAYPPWCTMRPTGTSLTKTSFRPMEDKYGDEKFQELTLNANRDTGFTRYIQPTAAHTSEKGKVSSFF